MKTELRRHIIVAATLLAIIPHQLLCRAEATSAAPERIGVYDSRVLAYAEFWSEAHQARINALVKSAKEAKAAGQTNRSNELDATLKQAQDANHLQVFSTAPVDEVLAGMQERVAVVQKEAGVSRLVSKWDEPALAKAGRAERVDVTDALLQEFKLTDKQKQVVADLRKQRPLQLDKARELAREGKL